jgi:hypothetical protein
MSCTDATAAAAGQPWVIHYRWPLETILGRVVPVWAGDDYPIPAGQPASALDQWLVPA